jgi:prenyltransferase beta subunit
VPNNTAFYLRFLAELDDATDFMLDVSQRTQMLNFLSEAQKPDGEIPYEVDGGIEHFQCYQYNAFQAIDLMRCYELTGDEQARGIAERTLEFLSHGIGKDGHLNYTCGSTNHAVTYHAGVAAAAFRYSSTLGIGDYQALAKRAYRYVMSQQRGNGSFPHSHGDYRVLSDRRSYPRYLAMILYHLLQPESDERRTHARWRNRFDEARA